MSELRQAVEDLQDPRDAQGLVDVQQLEAEQEGAASPRSSSSSSSSSSSVSSSYSAGAESLRQGAELSMMADLVSFLLLKYRRKQPTTRAEMLSILRAYQHHFPVVFSQASECMQLVFGVDVKEVDPKEHLYILVPTLGLTCDGMQGDERSMPKNGLLVILLGVIVLGGEGAPEEEVWGALGVMGVHPGREHFIYGEPRELITKAWVQEGYLEYRQVADSDPARHEFLWGPRAHAETSKLQVLEHLFRLNSKGPISFPSLSEEAVSNEEEGA